MRRAVFVPCLVGALLGAGCRSSSTSAVPQRDCTLTVWYRPSSAQAHVELVASWQGWSRPGSAVGASRSDGWRAAAFQLPAGEYSYALVDDGVWLTDPNVPTTAFHEGQEVTWVSIPSCDVPALQVDSAQASPDGVGTFTASFLASRAGDSVDPGSVSASTRDGTSVPDDAFVVDPAKGQVSARVTGLTPGKHVFTLKAKDSRGRDADDARVTLWIEPSPFDARDTVMYQVMVDRYRSDAGALVEPSPPSGRAGGTIGGVREAIESGELAALGINTLWLSPLYSNPDGLFPGTDGRPYSAYHGYWPSASNALEVAQTDEPGLDALVDAAHRRGMRLLFDIVPHHVHQLHGYWAAHGHDGWFMHPDDACVCGQPGCDWATHIEDCWFAPYLPTLDWTNPAVADQITTDALWWLDRWSGDGLRIDAVPMMPRAATRRIVSAARARFDHPGHRTFLLGENFTGADGYDLLRYELGPYGLDSEFHFPLMWALRSAIAQGSAPMSDIDAAIRAGIAAWDGSGAVMSLMIGNHDVPRFASVSAGDADGDPWTAAPQSTDSSVYARQSMALAVTLTLPGAPVVYYGDEVALAGRADPDSRRVLPGEASLSELQKLTRGVVRRLGTARGCSPALRRGSYVPLYADGEHLAYARVLDGEDPAIIVLNRSGTPSPPLAMAGLPTGDYVDLLSGRHAVLEDGTGFPTGSLSVALLLPATSACAGAPSP